MDGPVAVGQLAHLHGVVTHRRQAVAARFPRQQHAAGLHLLLGDQGPAGGLRTSCVCRGGSKVTKVKGRGRLRRRADALACTKGLPD